MCMSDLSVTLDISAPREKLIFDKFSKHSWHSLVYIKKNLSELAKRYLAIIASYKCFVKSLVILSFETQKKKSNFCDMNGSDRLEISHSFLIFGVKL